MGTFELVVVYLFVVALGMLVIHQLHRHQHERNVRFHYSEAMPGVGRRQRGHHRPAARPERTPHNGSDGSDGVADGSRPDHRDSS
ncbi:hypothetical protein ACIQXD_13705 [Streptomyces uncialis]|uniref:hypothetical protein n=1 Tax=Streptomyces uncialis TaxID=1048205 RepID=UPI0038227D34